MLSKVKDEESDSDSDSDQFHPIMVRLALNRVDLPKLTFCLSPKIVLGAHNE